MLTLQTESHLYFFCSTCRAKMLIRYADGDVRSLACPEAHESLISYKTHEGLKRYAAKLFQAPVGMGAKE